MENQNSHRLSFRLYCIAIALIFGISLRLFLFQLPHGEGDEVIYQKLVEQLLAGKGYTLQGTELLSAGGFSRYHYDQPLFFHPPMGIVFFAAFSMVFGPYGIGVAQLFLYAMTVCGLALLLASLVEDHSPWPWMSFSVLVPLQPILLHINLKLWIDNARIAWVCLAAGALCYGVKNQKSIFQHLGIVAFGLAALTKLDTVFFIPPLLVLLFSMKESDQQGNLRGVVNLLPSILVSILSVAAWCIFSSVKNGGVMTGTPGRPDALLIQSNPFIHYVTVTLPTSFYLRAFPSVVSTMGIVLLGILLTQKGSATRKRVLACVLGTGFLLAAYSVLGALGYSKLLRYVSQSIPLTIVSTCLAISVFAKRIRTLKRPIAISLGILIALFLTRELAFGIKQVYFTPTSALISETLLEVD